MRYDTGNPVGPDGSSDPRDLYDNAGIIDVWATDRTKISEPDRLGVPRKTWFGLEQQVNDWLANQGFEPEPLEYVDGAPLTIDRPSQLVQRAGVLYSVKLPASFPVNLTGTWATDQTRLKVQVDPSLRADIDALKRDFVSALTFPFDGTVAGDTAAMNALMASSHTKIWFPARVYYSGFQNEMSGRTFYFEEGSIIDGTAHLAIGKGPDLAGTGSTIIPCKNVLVLGCLTATVRIGTIYAENVFANKFAITEVNGAYPNQSANGGTSGVHIYFGCKNFNIGEIDVRSGTKDLYGLGIDVSATVDAAHRPTNIRIGRYLCSVTGQQAALATAETVGVTIDEMYVSSCGGIGACLGSLRDERFTIRKLFLDCQYAAANTDGVYLRESRGHTFGEVLVQSSKQIGFRTDAAATRLITVQRLRSVSATLEGARLESPVLADVVDTQNNGIGLNIPTGGKGVRINTLISANNAGAQLAVNATDVEITDIRITGPAGNTQFGAQLSAGAVRFKNSRLEASQCSQGIRVLSAGPNYLDSIYLHDNAIGLSGSGTPDLSVGKIDYSNNTTDSNILIAVGFRESRSGEDIRGDVSLTVSPADSKRDQIFATPLTAARTVTLGTAGAKIGSELHFVRTGAATGAFTLAIGTLKNLTAAGQWCTLRYSALGWRLVAAGSL